ncbi:hypothetical protein DFJ73DRAFT_544384 [Zopfochytrium polystomum]|nr:hypothetical protein DFJ73DRAFT_544384 [Zopfochytrium polystomum]
MQELLSVQIAQIRVEHEKEMAKVRAEHLEEMGRAISTAEAARQIESLTEKMDQSTKFVDSMQQRLENDHAYSIKEREVSFQSRERQLAELQRQLLKQQRDLDDERAKFRAKSDAAEATLADMRREHEEDRRRTEDEKRALEELIALTKNERDVAQQQLHRERLDFVRSKEAWMLERKKAAAQASEDQKKMAMERAVLEARRDAVAEVEAEIGRCRLREEAQILADRAVLEQETHVLAIKKADLHHEAARLRAERIALDADKSKLSTEVAAFELGWEQAEKGMRSVKDIHEAAVQEKMAAQAMQLEAKRIMLRCESEAQAIERQRKAIEEEKRAIAALRHGVVEERVLLASERATIFEKTPFTGSDVPFSRLVGRTPTARGNAIVSQIEKPSTMKAKPSISVPTAPCNASEVSLSQEHERLRKANAVTARLLQTRENLLTKNAPSTMPRWANPRKVSNK